MTKSKRIQNKHSVSKERFKRKKSKKRINISIGYSHPGKHRKGTVHISPTTGKISP